MRQTDSAAVSLLRATLATIEGKPELSPRLTPLAIQQLTALGLSP